MKAWFLARAGGEGLERWMRMWVWCFLVMLLLDLDLDLDLDVLFGMREDRKKRRGGWRGGKIGC